MCQVYTHFIQIQVNKADCLEKKSRISFFLSLPIFFFNSLPYLFIWYIFINQSTNDDDNDEDEHRMMCKKKTKTKKNSIQIIMIMTCMMFIIHSTHSNTIIGSIFFFTLLYFCRTSLADNDMKSMMIIE